MTADVRCLKIALIAEDRQDYVRAGYSEEDCAALTHEGEVQAVSTTLKKLGHHVTVVPGIQSLVQQLAADAHRDWDLAFNMAQGFHGLAREAQVPGLLEAYQIPYTFSDAATMALCQNKAYTKVVLGHHKIPTAPFVVVPTKELSVTLPLLTTHLPHYPLFVKPATEGSSKGIDYFNKVDSPEHLGLAVQKLRSKYPDQDILVESFLPGRELTVSILGTGLGSRVIGVREHIWQRSSGNDSNGYHVKPNFASRQSKSSKAEKLLLWNDSHDMNDPQIKAACKVALDAWKILGCRDAGRVDLRFDSEASDSVPNVLEVNPISGLLPGHSPLPASAERNGISFEELLAGIIEGAAQRGYQRNYSGHGARDQDGKSTTARRLKSALEGSLPLLSSVHDP